jgi:enoyl-CoA hydratase/carnithine racemase
MIEIEDHGLVRQIRLARPPVNALDAGLLARLEEALAGAAASGARAVVLSGREGVFSAGLDVRELASGDEARIRALVEQFGRVQERLARSPLPVVAAIGGHCPAGGAVMSMLCDYRIMADGPFRIGLNEVQMGLYPGATVHRCFERLIGTRHAAALLATGALVEPREALALGLVDEVVERGRVEARAIEYAKGLAALPPRAYQRTRALVRRDLVRIFDEQEETLEQLLASGWVTDETRAAAARLLGGQSERST